MESLASLFVGHNPVRFQTHKVDAQGRFTGSFNPVEADWYAPPGAEKVFAYLAEQIKKLTRCTRRHKNNDY